MKYTLQEVIDLTGATNEQDFINAFQGKTEQEIKNLLVYMFPGEPIEQEFIEDIKILVEEL